MVIEEESNMDQSSIGLDHSQSRLTNTSRMMSAVSHRTFTSTRRKFVYKDETAMTRNNTVTVPGSRPYTSNSFSDIHASAEQLNQLAESSESESEDSLEGNDLEDDLMAFD